MPINRKGQAEVWNVIMIFEVVLSVLIAAVLIYSAFNYAAASDLKKNYLEKDISLVVDAVSASGGKIKVFYPVTSAFNYEFSDGLRISRNLVSGGVFSKSTLEISKDLGEDISVRMVDRPQEAIYDGE